MGIFSRNSEDEAPFAHEPLTEQKQAIRDSINQLKATLRLEPIEAIKQALRDQIESLEKQLNG